MAIRFGRIAIGCKKRQIACADNFIVDVTVFGTGRAGDSYSVELWDKDFFWGGDDKLATLPANTVLRRNGRFMHNHRFKLHCDKQCFVAGNAGSSGETTAEVYAYVRDVAINGQKKSSPQINLTCNCDLELDEESKTSTSIGKIKVAIPDNKDAETEVNVNYLCERPDRQYFADELNPNIIMVAIGDYSQSFKNAADITWDLSKQLQNIFEKLDGMVVKYNQESETWEIVLDHDIKDGVLYFKINSGGLFGIASHSRYSLDWN